MRKNNVISYRIIEPVEARHVYELIERVFHEHVAPTYSEGGINTFLGMLTQEFLTVNTSKQFTNLAECDNKIIGTCTIINKNHIALLFVESEMQGKGVGKGLISLCIKQCLENNPGIACVTVSSSPNSVSFYEAFGFMHTNAEQNEKGMRYYPMEKEII